MVPTCNLPELHMYVADNGPLPYRGVIGGLAQAEEALRSIIGGDWRESFVMMPLDVAGRPKGWFRVSLGGLESTQVDPRVVFRAALAAGACSIIIAHNHPSGNPQPSSEDEATTVRLAAVGKLLGIPVVDHFIVCRNESFSFAAHGLL